MSILTIRICEESDAKQMLKDGTLAGFIETWATQFPGRGHGKLSQIKEIKAHCGCSLMEAKRIVDETRFIDQIRFQIGDNLYVSKMGGDKIWLYRKDGSEWNLQGELESCLYEWKLFPRKMGKRKMEFGEF